MEQLELAVYGKGGIGKSTISANLSAALALSGKKVMQIGCDPKHDSTRLLMHGENIPTVLDYLRETGKDGARLDAVLRKGFAGIGCIEAGGPRPGVGCAGRGIISAFEFLRERRAKEKYDRIVYDVLGDVVCGGFAVPVRREYADVIFLVTSGEYMSIYAANNILRGIRNYDGDKFKRVAGLIYNERRVADEDERIRRFAGAVGLPVCAKVPRSDAFALAEAEKKPLMELEGFQREKEIFLGLADLIKDGKPELYRACPLTDEELEPVVLGTGRRYGGIKKEGALSGTAERDVPGRPSPQVQNSAENAELSATKSPAHDSQDNAENAELSATGSPAPKVQDNAKSAEQTTDSLSPDTQDRKEPRPSLARPPLYGCAFNGAATAAVHLTDAVVLAHAPKACAFYTLQNITSPGRKNLFTRGILMPSAVSPNFECTEIGQNEAVFGGMEKLKSRIQNAMEKKPGAVVVISSCVSGIIGDDIREAELLSTPECPVITVHTDGDVAGDYMEGIRLCMHTLGEKLIDPDIRPEGRYVNLVGETGVANNRESDFKTVKSLLDGLDIEINCRFLGDATAQEMRNFLRAPLNIPASDNADCRELKAWLTGRYGCKFLDSPLPVGFKATEKWLYELGAYFHCNEKVKMLVQRQRAVYKTEAARLRPALKGKRVLLITANNNIDWLLDTMEDVGMKLIKIGVINYLRQPVKVTDHPERYETDENFDWRTAGNVIRECSPDLVLSNYTATIEGEHISDTLPFAPPVGFLSGIRIAKHWAELFQKNVKGGWQNDRALFEKYYS